MRLEAAVVKSVATSKAFMYVHSSLFVLYAMKISGKLFKTGEVSSHDGADCVLQVEGDSVRETYRVLAEAS